MTIGIDFLRAEELAGAAQTLHTRLRNHPLLDAFPRERYGAGEIKIRVEVMEARQAKVHGWDEPVRLGEGHDLRVISVEPALIKEGREISNEEESFFRSWDELIATRQAEQSLQEKRAKHIATITRDATLPVNERRHQLMVQCLQDGQLSIPFNGVTQTVSYGLTDLGTPTLVWSNASAKIAREIYELQDAFEDNADVPADTVFFNPKLFSTYLAQNTDWLDYLKNNPVLAAAFAGYSPSNMRFHMPKQPFVMFDMLWVPVPGKVINDAGTKVDRWDVNQLTFAALNAGDGQQVLEWSAAQNKYQPTADPMFRLFMKDDPMQAIVEYSDNGIPAVRIRERIQTFDCTST